MRFTTNLEKSAPSFGTWVSIGSPVISELAAEFGFDWLLFDLEHGCLTETDLLPNLQAVRGSDPACIVRVPTSEPSLIARVLDRGAHGIMVPHVTSADAARQIVAATRYGLEGTRGYSRTVRAYRYGSQIPGDGSIPKCAVMAQIENLPGVENAAGIAAVEGVDVLFVGPADLSHDLKARGQDSAYQDCLNKVAHAADAHGKQCGILVRNREDLPVLKAAGYTVFAIDSDLGILRKGYQETLRCRDIIT